MVFVNFTHKTTVKDEALKRTERFKSELKGILLSCAKKETENEKLQTKLDISLFKNQTFRDKFADYGDLVCFFTLLLLVF